MIRKLNISRMFSNTEKETREFDLGAFSLVQESISY